MSNKLSSTYECISTWVSSFLRLNRPSELETEQIEERRRFLQEKMNQPLMSQITEEQAKAKLRPIVHNLLRMAERDPNLAESMDLYALKRAQRDFDD